MRDIFKDPLSESEIRALARMAPMDELFSWRSPNARPYRDRRGELSDEELIALMVEEPRLVRRPILVKDGRLVIGFKPGAYDELLRE